MVTTILLKIVTELAARIFSAVAAKRDVGNEIKLTVAPRRVKFQRRISREHAAADSEHAVCAEHASFKHVGVSVDVIECDRPVAVDVRKERARRHCNCRH